jgi:hypothetical protein
LLVDVEYCPARTDVLADDGTMTPLANGLDQLASVEITGSNAYIATLTGQRGGSLADQHLVS